MNKQCVFCYRMVPVTDVYRLQLGYLERGGNGKFVADNSRDAEASCGQCVEDAKRIFQAKSTAASAAARKE